MQRYVLKHQQGGAIGVHAVFDKVGKLEALPKVFERQGRGEGTLCTHTPEDTHLKIHTLQETHTPEEMYSQSESEENADNENEDRRHCLAVEVDKPKIDDIMRGVFGYEKNTL